MKIVATFTKKDMTIFRKTCELIERCDAEQAGAIVNEVLMIHSILAFNPVTKHLDIVESVCMNGDAIQLNIEEYEVNKRKNIKI